MIDESNVKISKTRHLGWKIIAFLGGIAVISTALVLYAFGFFSNGTGYASIVPSLDEDYGYDGQIDCTLYFQGSAFVTRNQRNEAAKKLGEAVKTIFKVTEPKEQYPGVGSISLLNQSPNENVKISEITYRILKEAYEKTLEEGSNYSVFASPLLEEWQRLASLAHYGSSGTDNDPLFDPQEQDFLDSLAGYIGDPSSISLQFLDDSTVKLIVSEEYANFLKENSILSPIVSLNSLRGAYELQYVVRALEELGYHNGYLKHGRGYGMTLSQTPGLSHSVYALSGRGVKLSGLLTLEGQHCYYKSHAFNLTSEEALSYYIVEKDGAKHYRSPYVNLDSGLAEDYLLSTYLFLPGNDIVRLACLGERSLGVDSQGEWELYPPETENLLFALYRKQEPNTYHISRGLESTLRLYEPETYHAIVK